MSARSYRVYLEVDVEVSFDEIDSDDWTLVEEQLEDSFNWDAYFSPTGAGYVNEVRLESFVVER